MTTQTSVLLKIDAIVELNAEELWSAVWGSGFESDPVTRNWLKQYTFVEGDWDRLGVVQIWTHEDGDLGTFTVDDLANALAIAVNGGYHHVPCGGRISTDLDEIDSCVADLLLQLMVYGEERYA